MTRLVVLALVVCAALAAQTTNNAYVLPGDTIIPRIDTGQTGTANDGTPLGTFMTFQFINISAGPASIQMSFVETDGSPLQMSFELCDNSLATGMQGSCFSALGSDGLPTDQGAISNGSFLLDTLPVKGVSYARTFINGPRTFGYARILSQPRDAIAVSANFSQQAAKGDGSPRELFTASVPLSTSLQSIFMVPALNAGSTATLAIVSVGGGMVLLRAFNSNGTELCSVTRNTTVGEALAFVLAAPDVLPCTANRETMVEVSGPALAGVGFTFLGEAFSTQPVYGPLPAAMMMP